MNINPISCELLSYKAHFSLTGEKVHFLDFQPNLKQSLSLFQKQDLSSLLVLKSDILPEIVDEISDYFIQNSQKIKCYTDYDCVQLFGYAHYNEKTQQVHITKGILAEITSGTLLLNIYNLLQQPLLWNKLKQALLFGQYQLESDNKVPLLELSHQAKFKLILVGNRQEISALTHLDDTLFQFSHYSEIHTTLYLNEQTVSLWGDYVQSLSYNLSNKKFTKQGLQQLLNNVIRENENQQVISLQPTKIKKDILGIAQFYADKLEFNDLQDYFNFLEQQASYLNDYTQRDILSNQLYVQTDKSQIGQINGLSVVEFEGLPYAFGEPLRISCNTRLGDGEIIDIEHKVDLGGNIHAKGVLVAESCLAHLLELPTQLPFSASLVFEQSYGEVDGDSSSLAILCVLISSLANLPIPQSIAVTGAIDQFGKVLSVGGINQKIEGFFNICRKRGLTSKQSVIIPKICLSHLSLKSEVLDAVKKGKFSIWAVNDIYEVMSILFEKPFHNKDDSQESILAMIKDNLEQEQEDSGSIFSKICKKLLT